MYPHERSLVKELAGQPFALIGVNSDRKLSTPQKLAENGTVTWRSFQNGPRGKSISDAFEVEGWPTVILVDTEGIVRSINPQRDPDLGNRKLDVELAKLLNEAGVETPPSLQH